MSDAGEPTRHHTPASRYVLVWLALLVLTVVSFTTATLDLGWFDAPLMLGIATIKGILVVLVFMHLLESHFANRMVLIVSTLFVILLIALVTADVVTRTTFPVAPQDRDAPASAPAVVTPPS